VTRPGGEIPPTRRPHLAQPATWRGEVFELALLCAVVASSIDMYLLDRKLGIFTGGYLSEFQVRGSRLIAFACVSVLCDVAVLAPIIAAVLWIGRWFWMHAAARAFLAISVALGVVATADVAVYELQRYVGDLVNASVLVNLVGGDIRELLYFSVSPALHWLGVLSIGALAVLGASLALDRWFPSTMRQDPGARRTTFAALVGVLVAALVVGGIARSHDPAIDRAFRYKPSGRTLGSLTQWLSDVDRDGYGLLSTTRDPAPFNPVIHPYAVDVPGNGIDEDGVAGDLPAGQDYVEPTFPPVTFARRPDVVLVILESFRADAVGSTVGGKPVTPTLDRLRRGGVAATHGFSHNGFTVQSRYHAMTGHLLGPGDPGSLIDDFNQNGYQTAFFSAQDETFGGDYNVGFDRASVHYDARMDRDRRFTQFSTPASLTVSWKVLEERVDAFLRERSASTPLFLHLNFQDGHFPYRNPDIAPLVAGERLERSQLRAEVAPALRAMYLNTLANVDASLGRVLETVARTTGRQPAVVVIADHGESLFDEGFLGHGYAANDAQTRIPFIVHNLPVMVPDPIGQLDVRPLLREALTGSGTSGPVLVPDPSRAVFQYIGDLATPKEIARVGLGGRRRFNLMSPPTPSHGLGAEDSSLVQFWERVNHSLASSRR
jgi:hypothetical protein